MAATTEMRRQNNELFARVEFGDQLGNESHRDQRMIHWTEEQSGGGVRWQAANRGLDGGELAESPIFIDDDLEGVQIQLRTYFFGVGTQNHADNLYPGLARSGQEVFDECQAIERDQGFGPPHAPGFSGSEDGGGERLHSNLLALEKCDFRKLYGFVILILRIPADGDEFGGDADRDFFGGERADVKADRSVDPIELRES